MTTHENPVLFYEREYYMLSNFAAFSVFWNGVLWPTAEHAYQAAKFEDPMIVDAIRCAKSPYEAKEIKEANPDKIRPDFEGAKLSIMEEIIRAKFDQHPHIRKKLLETGVVEIIENSPTDSFWGWWPDKNGSNHLGKIWMRIRDELRK